MKRPSFCLVVLALSFFTTATTEAQSPGNLSELGVNDFRISEMGGTGDANFGAFQPSVAFNSVDNQYLVVWAGDDNLGGLVDDEREVFGQLLDAVTGALIGDRGFRISDVGGTGDPTRGAFYPSATYNSLDNQYLVIWLSDDPAAGLADNELEVFGQLLDAATGLEVGVNDFLISDMGGTGDPTREAFEDPSVAYNSIENEYLVVWSGRPSTGGLTDNELEIFGQRLTAAGVETGTNDFRISDMGGLGNTDYSVWRPYVAYDSTENQYLVVWSGEDNVGSLVDGEFEIFGQLLSSNGTEIGDNDFRISDMGDTGNSSFDAGQPSIAYNSTDHQYLVVFRGDDNLGGLVDNEREVFGQLLDATNGAEVGPNDFRISDMGGTGNTQYNAVQPLVVYNDSKNEYLVVWKGDDNTGGLVDDEYEIFGQVISAWGSEVGANDFRISDLGGTGDPSFAADNPRIAHNNGLDAYLVVWRGDDNVAGLVDDEYEVFGQRLATVLFYDGFESGNTSAWSSTVP